MTKLTPEQALKDIGDTYTQVGLTVRKFKRKQFAVLEKLIEEVKK